MGNGLLFPLFLSPALITFPKHWKADTFSFGTIFTTHKKDPFSYLHSKWMEKNLPDDSNSQLSMDYKKEKSAGLKHQQMDVYLFSMA